MSGNSVSLASDPNTVDPVCGNILTQDIEKIHKWMKKFLHRIRAENCEMQFCGTILVFVMKLTKTPIHNFLSESNFSNEIV